MTHLSPNSKLGVLFICSANVCRSPTAEAICRDFVHRLQLSNHFEIDSAGTNAGSTRQEPEPRACTVALRAGYSLDGLLSRQLDESDYARFDYLVCMDSGHLEKVLGGRPEHCEANIARLLDYNDELQSNDVPDPYYGGKNDFDRAFELIEAGCTSLLNHIVREQF